MAGIPLGVVVLVWRFVLLGFGLPSVLAMCFTVMENRNTLVICIGGIG